jgi:hypothetical protein
MSVAPARPFDGARQKASVGCDEIFLFARVDAQTGRTAKTDASALSDQMNPSGRREIAPLQ